jgi:hypothetical protein
MDRFALMETCFMPKRNLRIVKASLYEKIAVCEACNKKFYSWLRQAEQAEWEIKTRFDEHKCKRDAASQTALPPKTQAS